MKFNLTEMKTAYVRLPEEMMFDCNGISIAMRVGGRWKTMIYVDEQVIEHVKNRPIQPKPSKNGEWVLVSFNDTRPSGPYYNQDFIDLLVQARYEGYAALIVEQELPEGD